MPWLWEAEKAVPTNPFSVGRAARVVSSLSLVWMELNLSGDYLLLILSDSLGRESHVVLKFPTGADGACPAASAWERCWILQ